MNAIFKEIYILVSKLGFSLSDVNKLSPIEREIYLLHAKEEQAKQQKDNSPKEMILGTPIDPMSSPFGNPA